MITNPNPLFFEIKEIILQSRQRVFRVANSALLETYWNIGKLIVDDEQNGKNRAEYGKETLKKLANQLTLEFGKGFDERNLNNMRAFYRAFPIWNALRTELKSVFASQYLLYMPKEEDLKALIENDIQRFEENKEK